MYNIYEGELSMLSCVLKNEKYEIKVPALTYGVADFERHDNDEKYFEFLFGNFFWNLFLQFL